MVITTAWLASSAHAVPPYIATNIRQHTPANNHFHVFNLRAIGSFLRLGIPPKGKTPPLAGALGNRYALARTIPGGSYSTLFL
ncbi:MAG TPA: hypothetical protein VHP11_01365 [Tepidisphaeraceae bacterium]|nr:hypothetical protein [Tepidisphaeraceae bacterium]